MKTDAELLREFACRRAESAFAELVNRHINVVYAAACRENRDDFSTAQDVTQLVFIELAGKAATLQTHPTLVGWLYTTVRYISANLQRADRRRRIREHEVSARQEWVHLAPADATWQQTQPLLDAALHELHERDRDAVRLRFLEGKNLREVGDALCLSENAARMRISRELENLRKRLARRGIASTSSAVSGT
jgi:RNA polymerase sigma factor (sigma-70 family)